MIIDSLANEIQNSEEFQKLYKALLQNELSSILLRPFEENPLAELDLETLLECAITFATVDDSNESASIYHDIAYRIAILLRHYYANYASTNEEELYLIFSRLGRFPIASQYFMGRDVEISASLPILLFGPAEFARKLNTIHIGKNQFLLTNFQKKFWDFAHISKQLAVCAPTSAGKSFILSQYVVSEYFSHQKDFIAVYVVPTNALINEVFDRILAFSKDNFNARPNLYSTSIGIDEIYTQKAIYVLTQEKLSSLIAKSGSDEKAKKLTVNLLVVDEAQIIADGERGGITKNVIEDLLESDQETHIILGSPPVQNLEGYAKFFELRELTTYPETISPVAKNIIHIIKKSGGSKIFDVKIDFGNTQISLDSFEIEGVSVSSVPKCLASFAQKFGGKDPSLIYASVPSNCLKIAKEIANGSSDYNTNISKLEVFSDFIAAYIHPDFALGEYIKRGVGFHFGALPLIITRQLEESFRDRDFPYLVSTSTLLHGVNLPAKNLFLCRPKKGRIDPLDNIEFWNLVGRAGRLGKDFQGNIFVIEDKHETSDVSLWSTEYIVSQGTQTIESALDKCLKINPDIGKSELSIYLQKILDGGEISDSPKGLENVFSQLLYYQRKGRLKKSLERSTLQLEGDELDFVIDSFKMISDGIEVPHDLLNRHRDISPLRIQALYERLLELANENEMEGRIPIHPRDNTNSQAFESLFVIFRTLWKQFGVGLAIKRQRAMATIAFKWMEGENYNVLAREYVENNDFGSDDPTTKIYNFFSELQRTISFEYSKYMRCYSDVLELVNKRTSNPFLGNRKLPPLHSFLEDGTYILSQLSLIKNGLSRMTALEIYRILKSDLGQNSGLEEAKKIVQQKNNKLKSSLHPYFYAEAQRIFDLS